MSKVKNFKFHAHFDIQMVPIQINICLIDNFIQKIIHVINFSQQSMDPWVDLWYMGTWIRRSGTCGLNTHEGAGQAHLNPLTCG